MTNKNTGTYTKNIRQRKGLEPFEGQKATFRATVGRASMTNWKTSGIRQPTLELKAIYAWDNPNRMIADHIWVKLNSIANKEVVESLLALETDNVKRIVFSGIVYSYIEAYGRKGFHHASPHYSIGDIEVSETRPACF